MNRDEAADLLRLALSHAGGDVGDACDFLERFLGPSEVAALLDDYEGACLSGAHAPAGGVTVQGTFYAGGRFIPGDVMAEASPDERRQVLSGRSRNQRQRDKQASRATPPPPAAGTPEHREARRAAVATLLAGLKGKVDGAKDAAKRLGVKAWQAVPVADRMRMARAWELAKAVEHRLERPTQQAQELVRRVAVERGLPPDHVEHVARLVAAADGAASWTINWAVVHSGLHAAGAPELAATIAAKLSYYVPVASLAYLAWSAAVNPFTTLSAARKAFRWNSAVQLSLDETDPDAISDLLVEFGHADDADELLAKLCAALDATGGDLSGALVLVCGGPDARLSTDSDSPLLDEVLTNGLTAAQVVADEVRHKVLAAVKKKSPDTP